MIEGRITAQLAQEVVQLAEPILASWSTFMLFHDWQAVTGHDAEARVILTNLANKHNASLLRMHILVQSQIVRVGIATANLILNGNISVYTSQVEFALAIRQSSLSTLR